VISAAQPILAPAFQPYIVMNDYNPGNVLVDRLHGRWQVTGLFDLMEYYFGDGDADLMRLIAIYLEQNQQHGVDLARAFASAYLTQKPARQGFAERYALYMLRDRLIAWEYGTRPGNNWFRQGQSFRDYAEPFTLSVVTFGEENLAGRPARHFYERMGFQAAEVALNGPEGGTRQVFRRQFV
jgi:hypothetical protein